MNTEVNFEKRGKLEDHQSCPVCGCCVCDGHRHNRFNPWIIALLFLLSTFCFPHFSLAQSYTFETIEFPGATETIAYSINDRGQVTGTHRFLDFSVKPPVIIPEQGFVWLDGKFKPVEFPGASQTSATAINNQGDIVGTADLSVRIASFLYANKPRARAERATIEELASPGFVIGLNDERVFVGEASLGAINPNLPHRQVGFLLEDGQASVIDPEITCLIDQPASSARGINGNLVIVGFTFCSDPFGWTAFVSYDGGDSFVLFDFPGALRTTIANSVNEHNEIAGNYQDSNGTHGFVFSNGFISIDVPGAGWTIVSGINRRGEVTGSFLDPSGIVKSFVATPERGWRRQ